MNSSSWVIFLAIFTLAMPSWGQNDSVVKGGREWLQPADFFGYTYDEVSAVCPGGVCSGSLRGSTVDLTGYTWASVYDVSLLFNTYDVTPPFSAPFQERVADNDRFCDDFTTEEFSPGMGGSSQILGGLVRDGAPPNKEGEDQAYVSGVNGCGLFTNPEAPGGFLAVVGSSGVWFWRRVGEPPPAPKEDFVVTLEEPIKWEAHSGIGSLRGWAVAEDGIERVEIDIDGEYVYDAPFGGERTDVGEQYPDIAGSYQSGFTLAFGYSNLDVGEHTITARAFTELGESREDTSTFNVEAFEEDFISSWEIVDTSQANIVSRAGNQIHLEGVWVGGVEYILTMIWRTAEQGFELVDIARPIPTPGDDPVTYFGVGEDEGIIYSICLNLSADATQLETNQSECADGSSFDLDMVIMSSRCEVDFKVRSYEEIPIVDGQFVFNTGLGFHINGGWEGATTVVTGYVQSEDTPCVGDWSASSEDK